MAPGTLPGKDAVEAVSIRKSVSSTTRAPIRKEGFFAGVKETKRLRGGELQAGAQANVWIEAEFGEKGYFRMESGQKGGSTIRSAPELRS